MTIPPGQDRRDALSHVGDEAVAKAGRRVPPAPLAKNRAKLHPRGNVRIFPARWLQDCRLSVPPGQWPDGSGESPGLPGSAAEFGQKSSLFGQSAARNVKNRWFLPLGAGFSGKIVRLDDLSMRLSEPAVRLAQLPVRLAASAVPVNEPAARMEGSTARLNGSATHENVPWMRLDGMAVRLAGMAGWENVSAARLIRPAALRDQDWLGRIGWAGASGPVRAGRCERADELDAKAHKGYVKFLAGSYPTVNANFTVFQTFFQKCAGQSFAPANLFYPQIPPIFAERKTRKICVPRRNLRPPPLDFGPWTLDFWLWPAREPERRRAVGLGRTNG